MDMIVKTVDIEDINSKVQRIISYEFPRPTLKEALTYKDLICDILNKQKTVGTTPLSFEQVRAFQKRYNFYGKQSYLLEMFDILRDCNRNDTEFTDEDEEHMTRALRIKRGKSHSGINSITILMSPYPEFVDPATGTHKKQEFSCKWNCRFCPNDPNAPRSYLSLEPAVLRSIKNDFSVTGQMWDRMNGLYRIGHRTITKLEIITEGGTVSNYPIEYRDEFARDIYYAANTFWEDHTTRRPPFTRRPGGQDQEAKTEAKTEKMSLSHIMAYSIDQMITAYHNNVWMHFPKYVKKLIFCTLLSRKVQELDGQPPASSEKKLLGTAAAKACNLLLYGPGNASWAADATDLATTFAHLLPVLPTPETNRLYDMKSRPWRYLQYMVWMNRELESAAFDCLRTDAVKGGKTCRLYSPLALISTFIPNHIRLDTSGVAQLLMNKTRIQEFASLYEHDTGVHLRMTSKEDMLSSYQKLTGSKASSDKDEAFYATALWKYICNFTNCCSHGCGSTA